MTTSTRRFGIEIEFLESGRSLRDWADVIEPIIRRHGGRLRVSGYEQSDGTTWDLKVDRSCGYELATPALTWDKWQAVEDVVRALVDNGARVDSTCGLHVHHESRDLQERGLRRVLALWAEHEDALFGCVAPSRDGNNYCARTAEMADAMRSVPRGHDSRIASLVCRYGRYMALNLTNWWSIGTVEVRMHHGTLNVLDIKSWIALTQRLVEYAASTKPLVRRPPTNMRQKLNRLFYAADMLGNTESANVVRDLREHLLAAALRRNPALFAGGRRERVA